MPSEGVRAQLQTALAQRGSGVAPSPRRGAENPSRTTRPVGSGTGFFISPEILITNYHVVQECAEVRLRKRGAETGRAVLHAINRGDDLAALRSDSPSEHVLKLRVGAPIRPAEIVLVFGYPLSTVLSSLGNTTLGNVTALSGIQDDSRFIQISAAVQPGNSGGPVMDQEGRLIGAVVGKLDAIRIIRATGDVPQNVNFAIRASTIVHFLETNRIAYEVASSATPLPNPQVAELAEKASVQLECRR